MLLYIIKIILQKVAHLKTNNILASSFLTLALFLSACGGGGDSSSSSTTDVGTASVAIESVPLGSDSITDSLINAQCGTLGGIAIYSGIDTNKNGELDLEERVGDPQVVCNGGTIADFTANELPAGDEHCPLGGIELIAGDQTTYLCNRELAASTDFTQTSIIRGTVALPAPAPASPDAPSRVSSNMEGGLWLTAEKIQAAIDADLNPNAADTTTPIPPPVIDPIKVTVGEDGSYVIPDLPSGEYSLVYIDSTTNEGEKIENITVAPGNTVTKDITQTAPNASLSLSVKSLQLGSSIEDATVRLNELNQVTTTSADGTAAFTGLPAGTYSIRVSQDGYVSKYMTFTLTSGVDTNLSTIELNSEKGSLSGKVTANVVDDLANIIVYAKSADGSLYTTLTDSSGSYNFPALPVGDGYSILAMAHDFEGAKVSNVTISANQEATVSDIVLSKYQTDFNLGSITGFARFSDIEDQLNHAGIVVSIEGTDFEAITSRDGSFILNNLEQGSYILNFSHATHLTQTLSVRVVAGASTEMDDVEMLARTGSLIGTISFPADFGDTQNVKVSIQDLNGNIVKETFINGSGDFIINNITIGENYILRLNGEDLTGNSILSQTVTDINISANSVTTLDTPLTVEYVDPNPPIITAITYDANTSVNPYGALMVNPSLYEVDSTGNKILVHPEYLNFVVVASDADGDTISYQYSVDAGTIVLTDKNQMKWLAPETGESVRVTFTATSNARSTTKTLDIAVNHAPTVTLTSPEEINLKDDANILTQTSLDIFSFSATANDFEDGDLSGNSIEWYSNLQGLIGTGNTIRTTLKPGKHTITIKATDSQALTTQSQDYFVQVNTPDQILLKVPGTSIDYNNVPLSSQYSLDIVADELTLNYSSSNPAVATVDANGTIDGVATGAVTISIVSTELNTLGEPAYATTLVVRVVDEADSTVVTNMDINSIYQVRVNANTVTEPITFNNLLKGHYSVILFDESDIVADSRVSSKVTKSGADVTSLQKTGVSYVVHTFEVSAEGDSYSLYLQPSASSEDAIIKIGFYPGDDVRDVNGYINETYFNKAFEPNESPYMSKAVALQEKITSTLSKDDNFDYYSVEVVDGQEYTLEFASDASSSSSGGVYLSLIDTNGNTLSLIDSSGYARTDIYKSKDTVASYTFTATTTGKVLVKMRPSSSYYDQYYKYWFQVLPSTGNGLVQDSNTYEPNNTPNTVYAQSVPLQTKLESELTSDILDSYDYFSVELTQGQEYTLEFASDASSSSSGGIYLSLIDTTGNTLSIVDSSGSTRTDIYKSQGDVASYTFTAATTGKVLVKIRPSSSSYYDEYYKYSFEIK